MVLNHREQSLYTTRLGKVVKREINSNLDKLVEEDTGNNTSASVDVKLHGSNLSINLLHKVNHEIDKLNLLQVLKVEIGEEERNVVALNGGTTENLKLLGTHGKETRELVNKDGLKSVGLLNLDGNTHRVNRSLDKALLISITSNDKGLKEKLLAHSKR